jgi:hypothetical protein
MQPDDAALGQRRAVIPGSAAAVAECDGSNRVWSQRPAAALPAAQCSSVLSAIRATPGNSGALRSYETVGLLSPTQVDNAMNGNRRLCAARSGLQVSDRL